MPPIVKLLELGLWLGGKLDQLDLTIVWGLKHHLYYLYWKIKNYNLLKFLHFTQSVNMLLDLAQFQNYANQAGGNTSIQGTHQFANLNNA